MRCPQYVITLVVTGMVLGVLISKANGTVSTDRDITTPDGHHRLGRRYLAAKSLDDDISSAHAFVLQIGDQSPGANASIGYNNPVLSCPISTNGTLETCINAGSSNSFVNPQALSLTHDGKMGFFISTDYYGSTVIGCSVRGSALVDCKTLLAYNDSLSSLFLSDVAVSNGDNTVYLTGGDIVLGCSWDGQSLGECRNSTVLEDVAAVALPSDDASIMYLNAPSVARVIKCDIKGSSVISCVDAASLPSQEYLTGLAIGPSIAYIATSEALWQCTRNSGDGTLVDCTKFDDNIITNPQLIQLSLDEKTLYVPDGTGKRVVACTIASSGLLQSCQDGGGGSLLAIPQGIGFSTNS